MSELHATLGLANLPYVEASIGKRRQIYCLYQSILGAHFQYQEFDPLSYNYAYMPIVASSEAVVLQILSALNTKNVFPRRYFYPSLNQCQALFSYQECAVSEDISRRILCLPIYHSLDLEIVEKIAHWILAALQENASPSV